MIYFFSLSMSNLIQEITKLTGQVPELSISLWPCIGMAKILNNTLFDVFAFIHSHLLSDMENISNFKHYCLDYLKGRYIFKVISKNYLLISKKLCYYYHHKRHQADMC